MSDQERVGFVVDQRDDGRPEITFLGPAPEFDTGGERIAVSPLALILPSFEAANTLRDALSAFIALRRRNNPKSG